MQPLVLQPIGVIHTPFADRASAPRQPNATVRTEGRVELFNGHNYHHGLEDLESWRYIWVLFWFHLNRGWSPKVLPPRSQKKRGVFATRSPYRPNPIGLSVVELLEIEGRVLYVRGVDMVDGSPLLDIKPYVPYADAIDTHNGWLETAPEPPAFAADPKAGYSVSWEDAAIEQIRWLEQRTRVSLEAPINERLVLGPGHHYRRVMLSGNQLVLAYRSWRVRGDIEHRSIHVREVFSGYRDAELERPQHTAPRWREDAIEVHREYTRHFASVGATGEQHVEHD